MKSIGHLFGVSIIGLVCWMPFAYARICTRSEVILQVKDIGYWRYGHDFAPALICLSQHPNEAIGLLIKALKPINMHIILPVEVDTHMQSMHVIWALRALYYLTGMYFVTPCRSCSNRDYFAPVFRKMKRKASSDHAELNGSRARRYYFLTLSLKSETAVSFYADWMSRDAVYVAPQRFQKKIIGCWLDWYQGKHKPFKSIRQNPYKSIDQWYFGGFPTSIHEYQTQVRGRSTCLMLEANS